MFQKEKIENSNVWKREIREIQCLKKRKSRTPMFGKAKTIMNSNVWKSPNKEC